MPHTTTDLAEVEFNALEVAVGHTIKVVTFLQEYSYLTVGLFALQVLMVWFVFNYHKQHLDDHAFFIEHIDVAGRFTVKTYDMYCWLCMTVAPFGFLVILFTCLTRFNTRIFISVFGTKRLKTKL